ncbi:hypothetical protein EJ110_NYTH56060 [Nymphaea thermarum]|nr:hypothetical protein EJ110_NYTH56060 [Nymphaea thermarum]
MTGEATTHYLLFEHNTADPTWEKYKASLQLQFGDSTFIDYDEDLKNLVQTTTVPEYKRRFERLASMVWWPDKALIGAFKGGLRSDIKREIHRFEKLEECIAMARLYEERIEERNTEKMAYKVDKQRRKGSYSSGSRRNKKELVPFKKGNEQRPQYGPNQGQGQKPPARYLTPKQIEEYSDEESSSSSEGVYSSSSSSSDEEVYVRKGKSRAEKKESRNEKKNERKREESNETPPPKEEKSPETESLHSMQDPNKPNSFKVFGRINGKKVLILLDNGATKNFLTEEAAQRCNIPLETSRPQTIVVGGGLRLQCLNEGKDLEVVIKKNSFKIDFLVIPLDGVDLILGMPWFFTLGIISWDVKNFSMTFTPDGDQESMTLDGLTEDLPEEVNRAPKPVAVGERVAQPRSKRCSVRTNPKNWPLGFYVLSPLSRYSSLSSPSSSSRAWNLSLLPPRVLYLHGASTLRKNKSLKVGVSTAPGKAAMRRRISTTGGDPSSDHGQLGLSDEGAQISPPARVELSPPWSLTFSGRISLTRSSFHVSTSRESNLPRHPQLEENLASSVPHPYTCHPRSSLARSLRYFLGSGSDLLATSSSFIVNRVPPNPYPNHITSQP